MWSNILVSRASINGLMVTNSIHINATACCTNINNIIGYRRATPFTFTSIKRCLQPYMHIQKKSQRKSLNHARRTSIRPGHHRHFIGFQAGSDVPEPGRSAAASPHSQPRVKAKPPFTNAGFRLFRFLNHGCHQSLSAACTWCCQAG